MSNCKMAKCVSQSQSSIEEYSAKYKQEWMDHGGHNDVVRLAGSATHIKQQADISVATQPHRFFNQFKDD